MATDAVTAARMVDAGVPRRLIHFLNHPASPATALACLADEIKTWFAATYHTPTPAQRFAWPALSQERNLLLTAPTGAGKTLAAFLPIVSSLLADPSPGLRCIYVAPLKALIRDVAKNLRRFLRDTLWDRIPILSARDRTGVLSHKGIRIGIRTGDTSWTVRKRLLESPPHILLTTPESLAVLLSQPLTRAKLDSVRWLVVDEVHALAGNKRGADLALGMERLEALAGRPLQRIGLSATCTPLDEAARFLVGPDRACAVAAVPDHAEICLAIEPLPLTDETGLPASFLKRLLDRIHPEITRGRTTLIFANTRALAERVGWALCRRYPDRTEQIAVHHSSLAAVRRRAIERRLKQDKLWAAVSSTSLELGIDIGTIDSVVFVHPPGGAARLMQRLGRSGHRPGQPRRGLVLTSSPAELMEAAVTAAAGQDGQIERLDVADRPLDVLCQHLVGMAMGQAWLPAEALALARRSYPYRNLSNRDFDRCVDYLSGRHADGTPWLPARLAWTDDGRFTIVNDAIAKLLRRNLGSIVSDEPCKIKLVTDEGGEERIAALGSLDELFADRLQPGDRFLLGGRPLEYRRRQRAALLVREAGGQPAPPRWASAGIALPAELVRRLFQFRAQAAEQLRDGPEALASWLQAHFGLTRSAIESLTEHLERQDAVSEIPDERLLLIESIEHEAGIEYALHTPLPRAANEALARCVTLRLQRDLGRHAESLAVDLGVLLCVRGAGRLDPEHWRTLLDSRNWVDDLRAALDESWLVRERFGNVAKTGLMVLRHPEGGRRKVGGRDWAERRLFEQVQTADPEFVLLEQAQREVGLETCNSGLAEAYCRDLAGRMIRCRWLREPSPFAAGWLTGQPNSSAAALTAAV